LLYKQTAAHPYQFYKSLDYTEGQLQDENIENLGKVSYRIKFKYAEEKYSTLSKEKIIMIKNN
jgi:hypothetical protein